VTPVGGADGGQYRKAEIYCRARRHGGRVALAARALGIEVQPDVLFIADEVIE
jgi:hypothetical protein